MTTDNSQHQSAQMQKDTETVSHSDSDKKSQLFSLKKSMVLCIRDYKIIFCISIVLLILGAFRIAYLPMSILYLFAGGVYGGGDSFTDFILFLPTFIWELSIIFLPIILVLHFLLDRRLQKIIQNLEKTPNQQDELVRTQTK
ncbi:hypothetical protein [Bartonella massiliensis]|uniref:hypothetical protein n=1 Tax=Bartonella massiliensis TaxID=929795 RepID=UPI00115A6FF3|nr:hypothetical protein [Bartonella massiliensis]